MRAGELRHRITIEQATETRDGIGGVVEQWTPLAGARWAKVEPLTGRELLAAQQVNAQINHRVTLRHLAGVTAKMRVKFGARIFRIHAVLNLEERNRELQLLCQEPA